MMRRGDEQFPDNGFEAWGGYMHAKISKLEDQFSSRAGTEETLSNVFNGVSIYVNGFTVPSADELKILMSKHGGVYHTYQRSDDFIIASNLPDTKVKNMNLAKVVKPEWIVESLAANRLLDYREYLLYRNSKTQKQIHFKKIIKEDKLFSTEHDTKSVIVDNNVKQEKKTKELKPTINEEKPLTSTSIPSEESIDASRLTFPQITKPNTGALTKTAVDPEFISEFYKKSRLHHISQLGACFKQHINELREISNFKFPARAQLKEKILAMNNLINLSQLKFEKYKVIMHIDMDCFFVSVGLRNRPDLIGKPVAVTHSKGGQGRPKRPGVDRSKEFNLYKQNKAQKLGIATVSSNEPIQLEDRVDDIGEEDGQYGSMSEIASCSYEARAKGLKNGMFMGAALRLCPDLHTIPYDFDGYKEVAYTLYNTIAQYSLDIEAVSCDEMYVDCTELLSDINVNVQNFAATLREEIKAKTGCPCSTGFGGNRLQARLATKKAKPDGQFFLTEDLIEDFIYDIKLRDLPGVGSQTAHKLESLGHVTCGSLQILTLATLKSHLGNKTGAQLFDQCRGRDPNPLTFYTVRKSVSAEVNYGIRFENYNQCLEFLKQLSAEVHSRMCQFKVLGKCITLKLMVRAEDAPVETAKYLGHGYCDVINKSVSLQTATNDIEVITREVISLCKKQNVDPTEMRGIGIQVTKLDYLGSKPTVGAMNKFLFNNQNSKAKINVINENIDTVKIEPTCTNQLTNSVTPKKSIVTVSPKKSPIISVKSPSIRKRGRSLKNLKPIPSNNLINKFLQGQSVKRDMPYKDPMVKYCIKQEMDVKVAPPETARGLLGLPWKKVRDLLRAWFDSGQTPLQCDVSMITEYLQQMVIYKNIEKLYILMNFLNRRTREIDSVVWFDVYNRIHEEVQNAMIAVYGKKLFITS